MAAKKLTFVEVVELATQIYTMEIPGYEDMDDRYQEQVELKQDAQVDALARKHGHNPDQIHNATMQRMYPA